MERHALNVWPRPSVSTRRRALRLVLLLGLAGVAGCGTNFSTVLAQTTSATGRTLLDLFLTDLANTLADSLVPVGTTTPVDQTGGTGGIAPTDGAPIDTLTGDAASGAAIFSSNGCTSCHCADASGGCALSAPSLLGVSATTLDDRLRGSAIHPGGKFDMTNQDIVDLEAFLASL